MNKFSEELRLYFESVELTFTLFPDKTTKSFKSLDRFNSFLAKEVEYWSNCTQGESARISECFRQIHNYINDSINHQESNIDYSKNQINQAINLLKTNSFPVVFSSTAVGTFIKGRYESSYLQADAAIHYLLNSLTAGNLQALNHSHLQYKDYMDGLFLSMSLDHPEIATTIEESELNALGNIRDNFQGIINDVELEYNQFSNNVTNWKEEIISSTEEWKSNTETELSSFLQEKKNKLTELETLYQEKLRLESPATYWKRLSEDYNSKGIMWKWWSICSAVIFSILLTILLFKLPSGTAKSVLSVTSVRSILIVTVLISVGYFMVNFFIKLSTSAFHLSKDANERYQLTYVYLSLLKEGAVSIEERSIVLQSIFSRADTGLLKGDSSPTLPDGLTTQLFKNVTK
ncbi:DUF6161 domain-containing protein [Peribacillus alkalitolerans]|uniref:DUF6161 domain-containing protein n=1 Tax=Peribacillus alkalitolerans TaxID=1550385 RepID=UPI0013D7479B|nr:DUF6161 domain-containing protein [Peribacillus alkalitolerans]